MSEINKKTKIKCLKYTTKLIIKKKLTQLFAGKIKLKKFVFRTRFFQFLAIGRIKNIFIFKILRKCYRSILYYFKW